jgi:hypothetical protein
LLKTSSFIDLVHDEMQVEEQADEEHEEQSNENLL